MATEWLGGIRPLFSFHDWWHRQGSWVEQPNQRRGGYSGVQRIERGGRLLYAKRQVGHIYRNVFHPFGQPTVLREHEAAFGLQRLGVRVPHIVFCGAERTAHGWQGLLITEALEGFVDLDEWIADGQRLSVPGLHEKLLQQLAYTLARMHSGRWQHGCLYGKHVFVRTNGTGDDAEVEVALIDLEKCRRRLTSKRASRNDLSQLRRHSSLTENDWQKLTYFYHSMYKQQMAERTS
jgi:tRNA A-37 threonylcarbamoyl transferase component Bud32